MPQINLHLEGEDCWKDIPHLQQGADGFLYTGYLGEIRPDVDGLTISHRCDATEPQEIIDLLEGYWKSKRDRQKPKGFGK
jgi:hypothetical protein